MKESYIEGRVRVLASKLNVESVKIGFDGLPDRMFLIPGGEPLFIEFKTPTGRLSDVQKAAIDRWTKYGYRVVVCRSVSEAMQEIKNLLGAKAVPSRGV